LARHRDQIFRAYQRIFRRIRVTVKFDKEHLRIVPVSPIGG
jgi:hypothetical protein